MKTYLNYLDVSGYTALIGQYNSFHDIQRGLSKHTKIMDGLQILRFVRNFTSQRDCFFFTNCFPGNTSSIRTCIELANHPKTIHKVTKPYMCVIYGFKFNIISRLEAHTRKHTGEKPYDTCSENFVIQEFKFHHHGHLQEKQYEYSIWKKKRKYSTHFLWNNN